MSRPDHRPRRFSPERAAARGAPLQIALLLLALLLPSALGMAASASWNGGVRPVPGLEVIKQSRPQSCGPALIATLAAWRGRHVSEASILAQATIDPSGISLAEFARLASLHGLSGTWYHVERGRLDRIPLPFVAHLAETEGGHYVAVIGRDAGRVVIVDPAIGALVGPAATLLRRFSGRVFVIDALLAGAS